MTTEHEAELIKAANELSDGAEHRPDMTYSVLQQRLDNLRAILKQIDDETPNPTP